MSAPKPPPMPRLGGPPRAYVERGRFMWRSWVVTGPMIYQREDGGPFSFTEKRARKKALRMLAKVERQDDHSTRREVRR